MRRDLLVGFIFTIALEFFVGWGGNLSHYKPRAVVKEKEDVITIAMPKIEPDEPE